MAEGTGLAMVRSAAPEGRGVDIASALTNNQWDELTDMVIRRLERNLRDELARRGRRAMPRGM